MNKFIDNVMNFINENTTLLIIICVFLIFVLIAYLIDNSIKTKKLAKMQNNILSEEENTVVSGTVIPKETVVEPKIETEEIPKPLETVEEPVTPVVETPVEPAPVDLSTVMPEVKEEVIPIEPEVPAVDEMEKTDKIDVITENDMYEPVEGTSNELVVDPAINDILLKDFTKNDTIKEIEKIDEEEKEDISLNPINNISRIEPIEEEKVTLPTPEVTFEPELPKVTFEPVLPKEEEKKSPYKNDKKLSDIFKKKDSKEEDLLNTMSLENELDRILSKLNSDTDSNESKDSTLDETMDFSNMF